MTQTLIVLAVLLAVWAAFALLLSWVRRREIKGEYPGLGEQQPEQPRGEPSRRQGRWKDGHRPWH